MVHPAYENPEALARELDGMDGDDLVAAAGVLADAMADRVAVTLQVCDKLQATWEQLVADAGEQPYPVTVERLTPDAVRFLVTATEHHKMLAIMFWYIDGKPELSLVGSVHAGLRNAALQHAVHALQSATGAEGGNCVGYSNGN